MKAITVGDEFLAQQGLSWLINTHSQMETVGSFDDSLDIPKFLQHNKVDAIFLNTNIPSLDGVLLTQNISQLVHKSSVVLITAWREYAVEVFKLEASDYILKPYQESRIINMPRELTATQQQQNNVAARTTSMAPRESDTIDLMKGERIIATSIHDIYYAEAHEKMTFIYTRRELFVMPVNTTEFRNELPAAYFLRCHRLYCVNLSKIREIESWFDNTYVLRLRDPEFQASMSRSRVKEFRQLMNLQRQEVPPSGLQR